LLLDERQNDAAEKKLTQNADGQMKRARLEFFLKKNLDGSALTCMVRRPLRAMPRDESPKRVRRGRNQKGSFLKLFCGIFPEKS
jgi:hypothetical protein